jgi:hypothetical protein
MNTVTMTDRVPKDSIILVAASRPTDYADCFHVVTRGDEDPSIDSLTAAAFTSVPGWAFALLALRNWIVVFFGLVPDDDHIFCEVPRELRFEPGERAVFFRVSHRTDDEIVMDESDSHLDFRTSVRRTRRADGALDVELTTVVWFNNVLGRLYFAAIRPFHRLILSSVMRSFAARMAGGIHPVVPAAKSDRTTRPSGKRVIAAWLGVVGSGLTLWMGFEHVFGVGTFQRLAPLSVLSRSAMDFVILLVECVGILLLFVGGLSIYFSRGLAVGDRTAKVFFACVSVLLLGRVALEVMHPVTVMEVTPPVLIGVLINALFYWAALGLAIGGQSANGERAR